MTCFAGVAVFGAIPGITIAIVIAVIEFLWDGWRPHSAVLGRVERVKGYHDITRYSRHGRFLASCCSGGMRPSFSRTPSCFTNASWMLLLNHPRRALGGNRGGTGHECRCHCG